MSVGNLQAFSGFSMILIAVTVLNKTTVFPGWWALLPTFGTVLLISAGPDAWINRKLLSNRAFVLIGLISYPLYLWHWPILSYLEIMQSGHALFAVRVAGEAVAFVLAAATYLMVEKPLRGGRNGAAVALFASLMLIAGLGLGAFRHELHARSETHGFQNVMKAANAPWGFPGGALMRIHTALGNHFERGGGAHRVLFIGDSHMEQYYPRIDRVLTEHPDTSKGVLFVTEHMCLPVPDVKLKTDGNCEGFAENALSVAEEPNIDTVVIGGAWNRYKVLESGERDRIFENFATSIVKYKKIGEQVYIILPIPKGEAFDPSNLVKRSMLDFGFVLQQRVERTAVDANLEPIDSELTGIARMTDAKVIDPVDSICRKDFCPTLADDGMPIYNDNSHLRPDYVRNHITFLDSIISTKL
jgi:hypothetical protein